MARAMLESRVPRLGFVDRLLKFIHLPSTNTNPWARSDRSRGSLTSSHASSHHSSVDQSDQRSTLSSRVFRFAHPFLRRNRVSRAPSPEPSGQEIDQHDSIEEFTQSPQPPTESILADRAIREEQDKAYELALARDKQGIEAAREAERLAQELEAQIQKQAQIRKERKEQEEARRKLQISWRRWARRTLIPDTPGDRSIEIAIRLPSGVRREGRLPATATLETLHILAETLLIPTDCAVSDDPDQPPEDYTHEREFQLVWTSPRQILSNDGAVSVDSLEVLRRGVLLIMESTASYDEGDEYQSDSDSDEES